MRALYLVFIGLVAAAFLVAVAVLVVPMLSQDANAHLTEANPDAPAGVFTVTEQPDLRPPMPENMTYTPSVTGAETFQILDGVTPRTWVGYRPDAVTGPSPVVILFHGAGRTGLSMIDMWQEVADEHGLTLVAMDDANRAGPSGFQISPFLHDVIDAAAEIYPIDRDQMFLFGHSAGAITAQLVGNRVTGPWRGIAVHAGYVNPTFVQPIDNAPPIRAYLGSSDHIFDPAGARIAAQYLARAGHDYDLILIPGHTHWFYEGGQAFAADAWNWFSGL